MKRFYLDSNVFIRFFLRDNEEQFLKTKAFFDQIKIKKVEGILSLLVLQEVLWILDDFYKIERQIIIQNLNKLLAFKSIKVDEMGKDKLMEILSVWQTTKFDLTDIYLFKIAEKTDEIFSFDKDFIKLKKRFV